MQHKIGVALVPTKCNGNPKKGRISVNMLQPNK
jgi:hypothetical protein